MRTPSLLAALLLAPLSLPAQETTAAAPKISPARQELLDPFLGAAGECLALANAIPEEKYTWRPM